jgi:hypothetical protein
MAKIDELHEQLNALSIESMGKAPIFNDAKNGMIIAAVIDAVGNLTENIRMIEDGEATPEDIAEIKSHFNEHKSEHKGEKSEEIDESITECLNSFPETAREKASEYLKSVKLLYKQEEAAFKKAVDNYSESSSLSKKMS